MDILREVLRVLRNPNLNVLVLYGQRRIGKTSLLQHMLTYLPGQGAYFPVYFDLQDKAALPLRKLLPTLALSLASALNLPDPDLGDDPEFAFREKWLPALLEGLPPDASIVLLLDEFDVLADPRSEQAAAAFFPYLRNLLGLNPQKLQFVFVLGRNIHDLSNIALSVFKSAPAKRVSLLDRKDTEKLVQLSADNQSLMWPSEAVLRVWELTHGHPYLTQALCSQVWEDRYDEEPDSPPTVAVSDVNDAVPETLTSSQNMLEWLWNGLGPAERVVAAALAEAGPAPVDPEALEGLLRDSGVRVVIRELQDAPELLQDWDLIEPEAGKGYRFRVELLRKWIVEKKPLRRVQNELDRVLPLAENLYQAGRGYFESGDLENAEAILRRSLGANPNHRGASELLAQILITQGKYEEARIQLERLAENYPAAARPRLVQVYLELAKSAHPNDRLDWYERVMAIDPRNREAGEGKKAIWQERAEAALLADDLDAAYKAFLLADQEPRANDVLAKLRERNLQQALTRLAGLEAGHDLSAALELVHSLSEQYPQAQPWNKVIERLEKEKIIRENYQQAMGALKQSDQRTAITLLTNVINLDPDYEEATRFLHLAVSGEDVDQLRATLKNSAEQISDLEQKNHLLQEELLELKLENDKLQKEISAVRNPAKAKAGSPVHAKNRREDLSSDSSEVTIEDLNPRLYTASEIKALLEQASTQKKSDSSSLTEVPQPAGNLDQREKQPAISPSLLLPTENPDQDADDLRALLLNAITEEKPGALTIQENSLPLALRTELEKQPAKVTLEFEGDFASLPKTVIERSNVSSLSQLMQFGRGIVRTMAVSPMGQLMAVGTSLGVSIRSSTSLNEITWIELPSPVKKVAFSGESRLFILNAKGGASLWKIPEGKPILSLDGENSLDAEVSRDGGKVVIETKKGDIQFWDASGNLLTSLAVSLGGSQENGCPFALSPNSKTLAYSLADNSIECLDIESKKVIISAGKHDAPVQRIAFSGDNEILASASADGVVKLWEVAFGGKEIIAYQAHQGGVNALTFSSNNKLLVSGGDDGVIKVWGTFSGKEVASIKGHSQAVVGAFFLKDRHTLISASIDNVVQFWDIQTWRPSKKYLLYGVTGNSLAFSPKGDLLAVDGLDGKIQIWNIPLAKLENSLQENFGEITALAFFPTQPCLAVGGSDALVRIWDVERNRLRYTLKGHQGKITALAFSQDGSTLASGGNDRLIKLWNTNTGQESAVLQMNRVPPSTWLVFSSRSGRYLTAGSSSHIQLWDINARKVELNLDIAANVLTSLAISPDGKMLAGGFKDSQVMFWAANTRSILGQLSADPPVFDLAFSPNGQILALAKADGQIEMYDPEKFTKYFELRHGQSGQVQRLVFSPAGNLLASAGKDGILRLWGVKPA